MRTPIFICTFFFLTLVSSLNTKELNLQDKYGFKYHTVKSPHTGKVWLDRNLGASRVCESYYDKKCFGDYFQWGRNSDGHEKSYSNITDILSKTNTPLHSDFIITLGELSDWKEKSDDTLWQSLYDKNNPCPKGFRIPTKEELENETNKQGMKNIYDVYNSFLKLPSAGFRFGTTGNLEEEGLALILWTSTTYDKNSMTLNLDLDKSYWTDFYRSAGLSVRCIKDQ